MLQSKNGKQNIIEIFGLQKAGKTTLLRELKGKSKNVLDWESVSIRKKLYLFIKYFLLNPFDSVYLFYKMNSNWIKLGNLEVKDYFITFRMRNSYLVSALAKYEYLKKVKEEVFVDEFLLQSLFMIFQIQGEEEEIRRIIDKLSLGDKIIIVEESQKIRRVRLSNVKSPATELDLNFKSQWIENCEFNYEIIKKILLENFVKKKYKI